MADGRPSIAFGLLRLCSIMVGVIPVPPTVKRNENKDDIEHHVSIEPSLKSKKDVNRVAKNEGRPSEDFFFDAKPDPEDARNSSYIFNRSGSFKVGDERIEHGFRLRDNQSASMISKRDQNSENLDTKALCKGCT